MWAGVGESGSMCLLKFPSKPTATEFSCLFLFLKATFWITQSNFCPLKMHRNCEHTESFWVGSKLGMVPAFRVCLEEKVHITYLKCPDYGTETVIQSIEKGWYLWNTKTLCLFGICKFEKLECMLGAINTVQTLDLHSKEDCSLTSGSTTQV